MLLWQCERTGRPDSLGELEISVTPARRLTQEDVDAYAEAGVDRIIVQAGRRVETKDDLLAFVESHAPANWLSVDSTLRRGAP